MAGVTKAVTEPVNTSVAPSTRPSDDKGTTIRRNVVRRLAPRLRAASSTSLGIFSMALTSGKTISGRNNCVSPSTIAVSVNMKRTGFSTNSKDKSVWLIMPRRPE